MDELNIKVFKDGDMYCALIGEDLESGIGGFGIIIVDAIRDFCNSIEKEGMDINYEICNY